RIVPIAQQAPADAENHRAVTMDQRLEGRLVACRHEAPQQFAVRQPAPARHEEGAPEMLESRSQVACCHACVSRSLFRVGRPTTSPHCFSKISTRRHSLSPQRHGHTLNWGSTMTFQGARFPSYRDLRCPASRSETCWLGGWRWAADQIK